MKLSATKYKEIADWINAGIQSGEFKFGDKVPSFTQTKNVFSVSRDTVVKAYNFLKKEGSLISVHGKGFFINAAPEFQQRVFLLFDEFTPYKQILFNSIRSSFGKSSYIDLCFHHYNQKLFEYLINDAVGQYSSYVIIPMINNETKKVLKLIPRNKLYLLDIGLRQYGDIYPCVGQNFRDDIFNALCAIKTKILKYSSLSMIIERPVNPTFEKITGDIVYGFRRFCRINKMHNKIDRSADSLILQNNCCYIIHYDSHLVELIEKAYLNNLKIGKNIGIISFNDTPLKRVVNKGITTISTDFVKMGQTLVDMVINKRKNRIENPFYCIERKSL